MALFENRFGSKSLRALGALVVSAGLMGVGGEAIGGHEGDEHADFTLRGGAVRVSITYGTTTEARYTLGAGTFDPITLGTITSGFASNIFILRTDITTDDPALTLGGAFINTGDSGEFRIEANGVASLIDFTDTPLDQSIGLRNIDTITIDDGGTAAVINAANAGEGVTFNLLSGSITSSVFGSSQADVFIIGPDITFSGTINGGDGMDTLRFADGFTPDTNLVNDMGTMTLTFSGGSIRLTLVNIETVALDEPMMRTFATGTPTEDDRMGGSGNDVFMITGDATDGTLTIDGVIDGLLGRDELQLNADAVVKDVRFADTAPTGGDVNLQNFETLTLDGGTVTGNIDVSGTRAGVRFNLISGVAGNGDIIGSGQNDFFIVSGNITGNNPDLDINGVIDGGVGEDTDFFTLGIGGVVNNIAVSAGNPAPGDVHLQNIEIISLVGGNVMGNITGSAGNEVFAIVGDLTSNSLNITGIINGGDDVDTFSLGIAGVSGLFGVVNNIAFTAGDAAAGDVHLQNIEAILLADGTVRGNITGSAENEFFFITGDLTSDDLNINGVIDGGAGAGEDTFVLGLGGVVNSRGVVDSGGVVNNIAFTAGDAAAGDVHLQNIEAIRLFAGTVRNITGSAGNEVFVITSDLTSNSLNITGIINGGDGVDSFVLGRGGAVNNRDVVNNIAFTAGDAAAGDVHLQNIEAITINSTVNGGINVSAATAGITFGLRSGSVGGNIIGSDQDDVFVFTIGSTISIGGYIDGAGGDNDTLVFEGADPADMTFSGFGLSFDSDATDNSGDVRNFERPGTPTIRGLSGLSVRGFEVLSLSPALNLYGALSDALLQFGAQTAQGFGLADLNLATGRATQLMSKDSSLSKGRVWAHKVTHSGNGKGSIGLGLTGLTARAESDYNYEMSLTQHGFDAPVAATRLGAFNLRAVSHTMTGVIETNVAEAQVSGYGAGVALLWQKHNFSAHLTSLASAYEVEATTSSLNPQAVVNEVSEGSFSAINAVISAGLADKRELAYGLSLRTTADVSWQTLSLDDFTETGPDGIAINFDKATRLAARVGAGLEAEHWFSDVAFVHETSSGGTLSSGLSQDYRQDDGTAFEMKLGGKIADLATGLTLKAYAGLRTSLINGATIEPSARFDLSWRF